MIQQDEQLEQFYKTSMKYINWTNIQGNQYNSNLLCSHQFQNGIQCTQCTRQLNKMEKIGGLLYHYFGTKHQFESYYKEESQVPKIGSNWNKNINENDLRLLISKTNEFNNQKRDIEQIPFKFNHLSKIVIHQFEKFPIVETALRNGSIFNRLNENYNEEQNSTQIIISMLKITEVLKLLKELKEKQIDYHDFCPHNLLIGSMPIENGIKIFYYEFTFIKTKCECSQENVSQAIGKLIHFLLYHTIHPVICKDQISPYSKDNPLVKAMENLVAHSSTTQIDYVIYVLNYEINGPEQIYCEIQCENPEPNIENTQQNISQSNLQGLSIQEFRELGIITQFKLKIAIYQLQFIQKAIQSLFQQNNLQCLIHNQILLKLSLQYIDQLNKFKQLIPDKEKYEDLSNKITKEIEIFQKIKERKKEFESKEINVPSEIDYIFYFRLDWINGFEERFRIPTIYKTFAPFIIHIGGLDFEEFEKFLNEPLQYSNMTIISKLLEKRE